ncbi:MAG: malto-oligosyltrehalose trehalohydrolase [Bacteroidota bacterium]
MKYLFQRNIGLNFQPQPHIRLWAPHARTLTLEIRGKTPIPLQQQELGYWYAALPGVQPGDRYLINIDGKASFPDPASLNQPDGVHQASQAVDLEKIRNIHHEAWRGIPMKNLVIYELHTGTFTPEGTFIAMEEKLDYLVQLGVNALKILPVATFPGKRNWGYDGVFPFAVQPSYGTPEAFANLVKACHEKGLAVILDVVYNHLGPEGNYLEAFGPVFTGKYKTPWGKALNFDDAWCDGVRHYCIENALMWLRDFHVDGLRLDAVPAIKDFSPKHFLRELAENVKEINRHSHGNHFLIAECDLNDTRYINPAEKEGYGMDAQWCDEWHHALHALITGERNGYYSDFGNLEHIKKSFNHGWVFTGEFSHHRKKIFGTSTEDQPGERFVVFTQNHDQVGNRLNGDRLSRLVDYETLKLAATAMMMSPFVPMIFMGEEYAEDNPFLYFIDHTDQKLLEAVRKGRKREFRDFIKNAQPPDPAAEETFKRSKLQWNYHQHIHKQQMLSFYKALISIRKKEPLLKPGSRENVEAHIDESGKAILLYHKGERESIITVLNFSDSETRVKVWEKTDRQAEILLHSAGSCWGGTATDNEQITAKKNTGTFLTIKPKAAVILKIIH